MTIGRAQYPGRAATIAAGALLAAAVPLAAAEVRVHAVEGSAAFLGGTFDGVRMNDRGGLELAARRDRLAAVGEPFAFSIAALPGGWAVGTGNDGKVLRVDASGATSELFDAPEPEIFALWSDADGTLFAGSSPDGKVYRIRDGRGEEFFDPQSTYIWAIARGSDGALWVATGVEGKLFRIDAGGKGEVAWDSSEPHLRSLLPLPGGELLIGTVGQGRLLRRAADGSMRTLYDSPLAEVVALARGARGEILAAVLASEASFVELEPKPRGEGAPPANGGAAPAPTETEAPEGEGTAGTRAAGATGPRSELVRIQSDGISQTVWTSQEETLFALAPDGERLWMGTGAEGRLYSWFDEAVRFEADLEERQVVGLLPAPDGPVLLTTNSAAIYRTAARMRAEGTFESAVADAGQPARYGAFRWRGARPGSTALRASFRFGSSLVPDETWTEWSAPVELTGRDGGEAVVPGDTPSRYAQFKVFFVGSGETTPTLMRTELAYRQLNQRPKIERFGAMDPGQILVPANFNPAEQVYEPVSPNREGIFTALEPAAAADARGKTLWKRGMRTLRWRVSDPNGDEMRSSLAVRAEATGSAAGNWFEIAQERKEDSYGFDATVLPDGRYRFRLTVTDLPGNDPATALTAEEETEIVVIDHSPPRRRAVERRSGGARLTVADDWNPLASAELSVDAGPWRELVPVDGLTDGLTEVFDLSGLPRDARMVLLRVSDAAFNLTTLDLTPELRP